MESQSWYAGSSSSSTVVLCICLAFVALILKTLLTAYGTPLRNVPGPWFAKFTRIWLFRAINSREFQKINVQLHRKYGPVVRIAPNEYSIDDVEAATIIYRARDSLPKAPRYSAWGLPTAEPNIFSSTDIEHAAKRRREMAPLYSKDALSNVEDKVDKCTTAFFEKIASFSSEKAPMDLSEWFQYYAFDVIGALTFGKPFGFMEAGTDIADIMKIIHDYSRYGAVMGVFSEWHPWVFKFLNAISPGGNIGYGYIAQYTAELIAEWNARPETEKSFAIKQSQNGNALHSSYLNTLVARHNQSPKKCPVGDIHYHLTPHVAAGAETTAVAMSATIYFLLEYPTVLRKLRQELDQEYPSQIISRKQAQNLPYLQAVLKETLRLFPPNGLILSRVVPEGGLTLANYHFPQGTIVGINSWVASANGSIFGPDPDTFRPERWLENEASSFRMDQYFLTFGRGPRSCGGKNISLMELSKIIPELLLRFDIEPADPEKDWTVHNDWFVRQTNFRVRFKSRVKISANGNGVLSR